MDVSSRFFFAASYPLCKKKGVFVWEAWCKSGLLQPLKDTEIYLKTSTSCPVVKLRLQKSDGRDGEGPEGSSASPRWMERRYWVQATLRARGAAWSLELTRFISAGDGGQVDASGQAVW